MVKDSQREERELVETSEWRHGGAAAVAAASRCIAAPPFAAVSKPARSSRQSDRTSLEVSSSSTGSSGRKLRGRQSDWISPDVPSNSGKGRGKNKSQAEAEVKSSFDSSGKGKTQSSSPFIEEGMLAADEDDLDDETIGAPE